MMRRWDIFDGAEGRTKILWKLNISLVIYFGIGPNLQPTVSDNEDTSPQWPFAVVKLFLVTSISLSDASVLQCDSVL
jgi:hypothetical protein